MKLDTPVQLTKAAVDRRAPKTTSKGVAELRALRGVVAGSRDGKALVRWNDDTREWHPLADLTRTYR